jgi:hypothetical protein
VTIEFNEEVTGFDLSDLILNNCQAVGLESQDNINFSFTLNPQAEGEFSVQLPANVVKDLAGNDNLESDASTIIYDNTAPTGVFEYIDGSRTNLEAFEVVIEFNEEVKDFELADIEVDNCTCANLRTSDNIRFTVDVTPGDVGDMTLDIEAGKLTDLAGNENAKLNQFAIVATGVELMEEFGMQVYPNPVKDYLNISSRAANEIISIQILDLTGKMVYSNQFKAPFTERVNMQNWSNGIYIVRIQAGGKLETRKIILSK